MKTKKSNPFILVLEIIMSILFLMPIALFAIYLVSNDPTETPEKVKNVSFILFVLIMFMVNFFIITKKGWIKIPPGVIMIAAFLTLGITGLFLKTGAVLVILFCFLGIMVSFIDLITPKITETLVLYDIGEPETKDVKEEETASTWKIIYGEEEEL